jgi:hypothetical protein
MLSPIIFSFLTPREVCMSIGSNAFSKPKKHQYIPHNLLSDIRSQVFLLQKHYPFFSCLYEIPLDKGSISYYTTASPSLIASINEYIFPQLDNNDDDLYSFSWFSFPLWIIFTRFSFLLEVPSYLSEYNANNLQIVSKYKAS